MSGTQYKEEIWIPKTRLGRLVLDGKIKSIEKALESGLPIKEHQIVDTLLPDLMDEVLDVNMVQRMTDSGRRIKFRVVVVVGNGDGYVGLGQSRNVQVGPAILKAINAAKRNLIHIRRGCGSWECGCGLPHTVPLEVGGKVGSATVVLKPAPRGRGIASGESIKKVLELAGIKDVWTFSRGETRTTLNFAKATYLALKQTAIIRGLK